MQETQIALHRLKNRLKDLYPYVEETKMNIKERIAELEQLQRDIERDICVLDLIRAGRLVPPKPGDECACWRIGDEHQLVFKSTGAEFTQFDDDQVDVILRLDYGPSRSFVADWLAAARAGYYLTEGAE